MQAGHDKSQSHNKNTGCRSKAKATKRHAPSGRQRGHLGSPLHLARARNSAVTPCPPPPPTPRAEVRNNRARRWWQSASRTCGQAAVQKRREKQSAPRGVAASAWSPGGGGAYHSTTTPIPCPPHPSLPPPPLRPAVATRASCVGTCCVPCDAAAKRRPEASPDATHAIARQHSADALAAGKAGREGG